VARAMAKLASLAIAFTSDACFTIFFTLPNCRTCTCRCPEHPSAIERRAPPSLHGATATPVGQHQEPAPAHWPASEGRRARAAGALLPRASERPSCRTRRGTRAAAAPAALRAGEGRPVHQIRVNTRTSQHGCADPSGCPRVTTLIQQAGAGMLEGDAEHTWASPGCGGRYWSCACSCVARCWTASCACDRPLLSVCTTEREAGLRTRLSSLSQNRQWPR